MRLANELCFDAEQALIEITPAVRAQVRRRIGSWPFSLRQEIVQDVLLRLWSKTLPAALPTYDPAKGTLPNFLFASIDHAIIDSVRAYQAQKDILVLPAEVAHDLGQGPHIDADAEEKNLAKSIHENLERYLPPALARVIRASQKYDTAAAAAKSIGMSLKSFHEMKSKAKSRITKLFRSSLERSKRKAA